MDANLAALLTVVVTSLASVVIALINAWNQRSIKKAVDAGNAVTNSVHTTVNGNNAALRQQIAELIAENARLNRQLPPEDKA